MENKTPIVEKIVARCLANFTPIDEFDDKLLLRRVEKIKERKNECEQPEFGFTIFTHNHKAYIYLREADKLYHIEKQDDIDYISNMFKLDLSPTPYYNTNKLVHNGRVLRMMELANIQTGDNELVVPNRLHFPKIKKNTPVDLSKYLDKGYNTDQLTTLSAAISRGADVSKYDNVDISYEKMHVLSTLDLAGLYDDSLLTKTDSELYCLMNSIIIYDVMTNPVSEEDKSVLVRRIVNTDRFYKLKDNTHLSIEAMRKIDHLIDDRLFDYIIDNTVDCEYLGSYMDIIERVENFLTYNNVDIDISKKIFDNIIPFIGKIGLRSFDLMCRIHLALYSGASFQNIIIDRELCVLIKDAFKFHINGTTSKADYINTHFMRLATMLNGILPSSYSNWCGSSVFPGKIFKNSGYGYIDTDIVSSTFKSDIDDLSLIIERENNIEDKYEPSRFNIYESVLPIVKKLTGKVNARLVSRIMAIKCYNTIITMSKLTDENLNAIFGVKDINNLTSEDIANIDNLPKKDIIQKISFCIRREENMEYLSTVMDLNKFLSDNYDKKVFRNIKNTIERCLYQYKTYREKCEENNVHESDRSPVSFKEFMSNSKIIHKSSDEDEGVIEFNTRVINWKALLNPKYDIDTFDLIYKFYNNGYINGSDEFLHQDYSIRENCEKLGLLYRICKHNKEVGRRVSQYGLLEYTKYHLICIVRLLEYGNDTDMVINPYITGDQLRAFVKSAKSLTNAKYKI